MSEIEQGFGNEKLPSVINDPFKKKKIVSVMVRGSEAWLSSDNGKWDFHGTVTFKNGDTQGEQKFTGENFDEVVLKIKAMINNLE